MSFPQALAQFLRLLVVLEKGLRMTDDEGYFIPDGFHPNARGNAIMAGAISRVLVGSDLIVSPCGGFKS